jgi:hypothetical protein
VNQSAWFRTVSALDVLRLLGGLDIILSPRSEVPARIMTAPPLGNLVPLAQCPRRTCWHTWRGDRRRSDDCVDVLSTLGWTVNRARTPIIREDSFGRRILTARTGRPLCRSDHSHSRIHGLLLHPPMSHPIGRVKVSTLAQKNGNAVVNLGSSGEQSKTHLL